MGDKISEEEGKKIIEAFEALKLKPKCDTPDDLKKWLEEKSQLGATAKIKTEQTDETTKQYMNFPRISTFSGSPRGETSYELWRYEIQCLLNEKVYRHDQILQAIRRSVKGEAANILMRLGPGATIDSIIQKMNSIYDTIDSCQRILGQFYSAQQEENESVSDWGCRLEQIINKAVMHGEVRHSQVDNMLRHAFWGGLRSDLKDISGYIHDKILSFDELRSELRAIEQDHERRKVNKGKKTGPTVMSVTHEEDEASGMDDIKGMLLKLTADVQQLKDDRLQQPQPPYHRNFFPRNNGARFQHPVAPRPQVPIQQQQFGQQQQSSFGGQQGNYFQARHQRPGRSSLGPNGLPICYRCGQEGHVQYGCRVRTDHVSRPLNYRGLASRGRR